jgi:translation initiation factor 3 subunit C
MQNLGKTVYAFGDENSKARALLCCVYHKSLFCDFYAARDLLFLSHLPENIAFTDIESQILYNRAIVQLGICAFHQGLIQESYDYHQDLFATKRLKELLAQGSVELCYADNDLSFNKMDKKMQLPLHMHINLELVETLHLISCILLDAANLSQCGRQAINCRHLQKILELNSHSTIFNHPDSMRNKIMAAIGTILQSDWSSTMSIINSLSCWSLLPLGRRSSTMNIIEEKIKKVCLLNFILTYSTVFTSLSLYTVYKKFQLNRQETKGLINSLFMNKLVLGTHDQLSSTITFETKTVSQLNALLIDACNKIEIIIKLNNKVKIYASN